MLIVLCRKTVSNNEEDINYNSSNLNNLILHERFIDKFKKGNKIKIKKKNRGTFTKYCKGKVTNECIQKAKKSSSAKLRKRAIFAENARKWNKK